MVSSYAQQKSVEVSYVGNAGFLINIGDKKILIDALFKGFEGSYLLPQEIQDKLTSAQAPFDNVDLILVTHAHGDHINPNMVLQHMKNNPKAIFASTKQTVDALNAIDSLNDFQERSIVLNPIKGKSDNKDIKGINIEAYYLPHGPDSRIINIGFLISVNGINIFQTGDVDFEQFTFEEFQAFQLAERKIDLAFIQHFYLAGDSLSTKFVKEAIAGKYIFPIHYHFTTPAFDSTIVRQNYPDAIIFEKELESWKMPDRDDEAPTSPAYCFNQTPPGDSAVVFAPGIFSLPDRLESNIAFTADGKECYFGVIEVKDNKASNRIFYTKYLNNKWSEQTEAPFSINKNIGDPVFSANGKRLYFNKEGDIWMLQTTSEGWGNPQALPSPINSTSWESAYTETADGLALVSSKRPGGFGGLDIWRIKHGSDKSLQAENLGPNMNSSSFDVSPFIAPDGSWLIFGSERNGNLGEAHLYICFNKGNGEWTAPINMNSCGAKVNNETAHHSGASLSPDGKFLFFRRHESMFVMDLYWVSSSILKDLKEKAMQEDSSQKFTDLIGDYLGQTPPGDSAIVFAPGIISTDTTIEHGYPCFSPDGNEVYWQSNLRHKDKETDVSLNRMRCIDGKWTIAEPSPYGGMPSFSSDGNKLFFIHAIGEEERGIYFIEKQGENWSEKKSLNIIARFPELKYMYGPSITDNGTLYFFGHTEELETRNNFGIYRTEFIDGAYAKPELLPQSINTAGGVLNWTPFIAPDGSYLLFSSNRLNNQQDIFISFRQSDGTWTEAYNLGEKVNLGRGERFPAVSPDGKYLFFTRWVSSNNEDIMWVSTKIIDDIKKEVYNK